MSHTPLKNKKVKLYYGYEDTIEFEGFEYESVKSAVGGCKEELIKHRDHYRKSNPAIANFIDSFLVDFDKWFEDVIG